MPNPDVLTRDNDIDVFGLFSALKRRWWLILAITGVVAVGLFLVFSSLPSRYQSTARIIIEDNDNSFNRAIDERGNQQTVGRFDEEAIRSQVEIISSDRVALEIIEQLGLEDKDEFNTSSLFDWLGDLFSLGDKKPKVSIQDESTALNSSQAKLLSKFKKQLNVYPIEKSRAIVIEFWSTNPKTAFDVPNFMAKAYVRIQEGKKKKLTQEAKIWLDPVLDEYRSKLEEAEADVAAFKSKEDILRSGDDNKSLARQQLSEISTELSKLRAERSFAQAKVASIRAALKSGASLDAIPEVIDSQLIQRLREREVGLRAQISELSTTLLPNHPRIKALDSQINDFQKQIRSAANNILKSLENNVNLTRQTEADLNNEIDRLKDEVSRVNKMEVRLDALVRKADSYRDLLSEYEKRNLEAISRSNFTPIDAEVYPSRSMPGKPYFPKVVPFTIAGSFAAFILTILAVLAGTLVSNIGTARAGELAYERETQHEAITIPVDEQEVQEMPVKEAMIEPVLEEASGENREGETEKKSPFFELQNLLHGKFKSAVTSDKPIEAEKEPAPVTPASAEQVSPDVRLAKDPVQESPPVDLQKSVEEDDGTIAVRYAASVLSDLGEGRIAVVSPAGDPGSKTAWILARQLAKSDKSVVIIDMSNGGATAKEMLGGIELPGIFNLASGSVPANNVIYRDQKSKAHVVPSGTLSHGHPVPDTLIMGGIVDAIALSYDFCIVDCGDANINGINLVSTDASVVIISTVMANKDACDVLESKLKADGFTDILQILPDDVDQHQQKAATEVPA